MISKHYSEDRQVRENIIVNVIGIGSVVTEKVVDKGHRNGPEIHQITTTGIIIVRNQRTYKMVTKMIARPGQLKRYFDDVPKDLLRLAMYHQRMGYNMV